ncbi:MAG: periplasmic heavy metal sensor [Deltaproteobacteria bacterium]|nr:MAG: periplasmic heavy metal sensor [Deltaproteobacteria bacterium]
MKRLIALFGILVLVGALAVPVLAHGPGRGRGPHMGWGGGPGQGYCGDYGPGAGNLTEEQQTQLDNLNKKFYDETSQLRDKMWTKSRELSALLDSPNPDADKARALQKEIAGLRAQLAEKRLDFELEERKIAPDARYGYGYGRGYEKGYGRGYGGGYGHHMGGYGHHMGGYGPGGCWQ